MESGKMFRYYWAELNCNTGVLTEGTEYTKLSINEYSEYVMGILRCETNESPQRARQLLKDEVQSLRDKFASLDEKLTSDAFHKNNPLKNRDLDNTNYLRNQ